MHSYIKTERERDKWRGRERQREIERETERETYRQGGMNSEVERGTGGGVRQTHRERQEVGCVWGGGGRERGRIEMRRKKFRFYASSLF